MLMIHGGFRHLPVVEEGKVVGILSIRDLMRASCTTPRRAASRRLPRDTLPGSIGPARVSSMTAAAPRTWWWRQRRCGSVR